MGEDEYKLHDVVWAYLNATVISDQERDDICLRLAESVGGLSVLREAMRVVMLPLCWKYRYVFDLAILGFQQRWVQTTECLQWMLKDSSLLPSGEHILCRLQDDDLLQQALHLRPSILQEALQWRHSTNGNSVLHYCPSMSVVKLLCEAGIYVNAVNCEGETPLYSVLDNNDADVAQLLVDYKARVNGISSRGGVVSACLLSEWPGRTQTAFKWALCCPMVDRTLALEEVLRIPRFDGKFPTQYRALFEEAGWDLSQLPLSDLELLQISSDCD
eukprot:TRINITY_DN4237_c0_g4_i1.p1 TRINITY_DN4237_c0_g4~~TRINITY_DN4237_c0_g4_i1.p1  ORF type:complete len:296 (-),score=45.21 TRINITY_DN4237_c0_g4_i1:249-1067(-)